MSTTASEADAARQELGSEFAGELIGPDDAAYEEARPVYNAMIDRRPALIARCADAGDVVAALRLARERELPIAVRGGGHGVDGLAVNDDGLVIDLAPMRAIAVDPERRTATAEGGVLWGELDAATQAHGLATVGGIVTHTGIAGLTLGGGLGWLMGKYGLAADNLVGAELVTAAGEVLGVDEDDRPDLLWALRGGGGNFGVVTAFTYRVHPVSTITGGLIAHPLEAAPAMLRFYRDAVANASDEMTVFAGLVHAPDGSGHKLAAMVVCHAGAPEAAQAELAPFLDFGPPLMAQVGPMPYPVMNTLLDAGYPKGALNYWMSSFTDGLSDTLIDTAVERFATVPSPMTAMLFEHFHGAVTRVEPTATAVPHRVPGWNVFIPSVWTDPAATDANIAWTRETHAALKPQLSDRRWLNYLDDDAAEDAIRGAYGPNYERLREIKRIYDPENVFHLNHNIAP
jgi:FAD/FMN-containing dehydrogenase